MRPAGRLGGAEAGASARQRQISEEDLFLLQLPSFVTVAELRSADRSTAIFGKRTSTIQQRKRIMSSSSEWQASHLRGIR